MYFVYFISKFGAFDVDMLFIHQVFVKMRVFRSFPHKYPNKESS